MSPDGLHTPADSRRKLFEVLPASVSPSGKTLNRNASGKPLQIQRIEDLAGRN